jgi:hypothetical protein
MRNDDWNLEASLGYIANSYEREGRRQRGEEEREREKLRGNIACNRNTKFSFWEVRK